MQPRRKKRIVASMGALATVATLLTGGVASAYANGATSNPNADMGYPSFKGDTDPIPSAGVSYNPSTSYLKQVFDEDVANGAGNDTSHDFWIDEMLTRKSSEPVGTGSNDAGEYWFEGADRNEYLFSRGRAAYMYSHKPGSLGFVGNAAYWDETGNDGFTVGVSANGTKVALSEQVDQRKQTPSYFTTVFSNADESITITEVKYITYNNVMVSNFAVSSATDAEIVLTAASPFAQEGEDGAAELTGRTNVKNDLTTIYPRFSGNGFTAKDGKLMSTISIKAGEERTTKLQLGLIADELPDSTSEYEARFNGNLIDPTASYKDSVTTYNQWWYENIPYVETPEHNIDKTVFYRWWLSRFNMLDANMPGNTFQYPTSIEGVLGYNNQIVLTSGMFINDTKWLRNAEYSYGTWVSAGQTAKKGKSGYYYYHDNPGDPANWNHSYTQYITKAGWDSYMVHGGPSSLAEALGDYGSQDVKGLLNSKGEPDNNDNQNDNGNSLIDWSWWSMTGNDADAVSFSEPGRSGQRMDRADGSANMWANANAAAKAYAAAGDTGKAEEMQEIADSIKQDVLDNLWDSDSKLLLHKWISDGSFAKYKELNNYYPYSEGLIPTGNDDYDSALRLFADADEFPIFPFFTANQADKKALNFPGSNNFSIINATPLLQIYSAGIRDYNAADNGYITNESYKKLLYWIAFSHYQGGDNRYPDQNEFWNMDNNSSGSTIPEKNGDASKNGGKITYRSWIHHTQLGTTNWTVIEDVAGVVPREDNKIELNPIEIPDWNHFTVNNLSYHGKDMSIVWSNDGTYDVPKGYTLYLDGSAVFTSDRLAHLIYDPTSGTIEVKDDSGAKISGAVAASMPNANEVSYGSTSRITQIFAQSGQNVDEASRSQANVAQNADVEATYETKGYPAANAVDGTNVMESFWGTKGTENAKDSIIVKFKGGAQTIDDVRLYFYQTSSSQTISGYSEPSVYTLEFQNEAGEWQVLPNQVRTPTYAGANYNRVQFDPVNAQAIRATFTHQSGMAVGVKEIQAYNTGIRPAEEPTNATPEVDAYVSSSTSSGAQIVGSVKDDGLPNGEITSKWEQVSGPENGVARFVDGQATSTTVTFNREGDYVLRLSASDGEKTGEKLVTVHGIPSDGTVNVAPQSSATASYTNVWQPKDNAKKVIDGQVVYTNTPNETWNNWGDSTGEDATLQLEWDGSIPLKKAKLYFWTDHGGVPMVKSWRLQYADADGNWKDVKLADGQSYTTVENQGNEVKFAETVETSKLRVVFPKGSYVGVSEFEAYALDPVSVSDVNRMVKTGTKASDLALPTTVSAAYTDGARRNLAVTWSKVTDGQLASDSQFTVSGVVAGALAGAKAIIGVRSDAQAQTSGAAQPLEQTVYQNSKSIDLPTVVPVRFPNGMLDDCKVVWRDESVKSIDLTKIGDYEVRGSAEASSSEAKITVHVVADPSDSVTPDPKPGPDPEPDPGPLEGWIEGKASDTAVSAEASWSLAADKLNDGKLVDDNFPTGDDQDVNAYVWGTWGKASSGMYAQYTWNQTALVDSSRVQFWANMTETNKTLGGLEIPTEWKIQYLAEDGMYKDVENAKYTVVRNDPTHHATDGAKGWSEAIFTPVKTASLRLVLEPYDGGAGAGTFGAAVVEWGVHAIKEETPDPPTPAVDKTKLESAIKAAETLEESRFTSASWSEFAAILQASKTVLDNVDATQDDVDNAVSKLEDRQKALVTRGDKTDLRQSFDNADAIDSSRYTDKSVEVLKKAMRIASDVLRNDDATQSEIDEATKTLMATINGLETKGDPEPVVVDESALKTLVARADALKGSDYTEASWKTFSDVLAKAKSVLMDDAVSQSDVDAADSNLEKAASALVRKDGKSAKVDISTGGQVSGKSQAIGNTGSNVAILAVMSLVAVVVGVLLIVNRRHGTER
ncbi:beta-L-arabinobiosidase HypBA2 [Bifidobacterium dentium]|uniref:beta-L-arabinobiosidase HypBA2 n=1 Tax=Bifidobacterium dentium TaxID=1689 RepID=UPI003D16276E